MSEAANRDATFGTPAARARLRKRRRAERRFRRLGQAAIGFSVVALGWLLLAILSMGSSAFTHHWVTLDLDVAEATEAASPRTRLAEGLAERFGADPVENRDALLGLVSATEATAQMRARVRNGEALRLHVPLSSRGDRYLKRGSGDLTEVQTLWIDSLAAAGAIDRRFNHTLFSNPDSRDAERAGLASALLGSVMIVLIAGLTALPVGIGAAIYLDSFAPRTGWGGWVTRALEVNLNNLAAVPPIVFGLLGLAVFINLFGLSRSIPLVGGLVLALRMFPTVVIATRSALSTVPSTITDGALSLGASRLQAVFGHKVPIALPGILTGSVLGMAQALGETAPLLMIGMVAFVTTVPEGPLDPATALPVQIFLWSGSPEAAWAERAAAAIIILLIVLLLINSVAIILRERLQRRRQLP